MTFRQRPHGTAIPVGSTLLSVRHQSVSQISDLHALRLSDKRIWMRIRDPHSNRRHVSEASLRILGLFETWLQALSPMRPLTPKRYWDGECAADACASGLKRNGMRIWFSEQFGVADFTELGLQISQDLQRYITCFEALAQLALLFIASRVFPAHRFPLCLKTLSDNTGAESGSNRLWSMSYPLCVFLEKLCLLSGSRAWKSTLVISLVHRISWQMISVVGAKFLRFLTVSQMTSDFGLISNPFGMLDSFLH